MTTRARRLRGWWPQLLFLCVAACALWPALREAPLYANRYDFRYFESMSEVARRTVLWYQQVPLWNPYPCGGEVDLANPQSLSAAPTFLLLLLFGTAMGLKLSFLFYYFCALDGTFRLGRRFGLSPQGALIGAAGFGLSGYLALHLSVGHVNFAGVTLLPYLLLCYDHALQDDRVEWVIPTGLFAAWIAVLGGTFTPALAGELLFLWAVGGAVQRRSLRPFGLLALAAAVALCAGAMRMLPALEFVFQHPRHTRVSDFSPPWRILGDLVYWRSFGDLGRKFWSHEYAARLPFVLLPLWAASLLLYRRIAPAQRARARLLWAVVVAGWLLSMGNFSTLAPWSLLQKLPVLRDLRVPSRHEVHITLAAALLAGLGWDLLLARLGGGAGSPRRRLVTALGCVLAAAALLDGAIYTAQRFQGIFTVPLAAPSAPVPFYHEEGGWRVMREVLFSGHGSLGCDEEAPLQRAEALDPGPVAQERLLDPSAGEVTGSRFSPNRRVITVELSRDTVLLLNSNWNEHFRAEPGRVTRVAGRLAVDLAGLSPGRHVITVRYAPRSFTAGALLSGIGVPVLLLLFFRRRRVAGRHS